ncbi:universal stress protein UspE [Idiomarina tyrosinivorans]|uniref:Universal stress protein UspE n=1 Tax=Idiomarina tyrosinivorans TaxID=1445662 RepID=A0A432ZTR0_9GAMM|nr:universal stress protein UspE [Idiomarina tyrosinivorans]RUO81324.1 universal stress protein UspE [Idiomarina tyrosinivorans]
MEDFAHILVVLDPADEQHKALRRALHLASFKQTKVTVFLSIYDFSYEMTTMLSAEERELMRSTLIHDRRVWIDDLLSQEVAEGMKVESVVVWHNRPFEAIIETAQKHGADLIVKGTHQHSIWQNLLFTPTDWHLIRKAPCPVLLVKEHAWPEHGKIISAVNAGSEDDAHISLNRKIMDYAKLVGSYLDAEVHAVNACPGAPMNIAVEIPEYDVTQYTETLLKQHKQRLAELAKNYALAPAQQHVIQGLPEQVIPQQAKDLDAELVILGTIGRTGFKAALLGNTAEHVIDQLNCDVLAVKPDGFSSQVGG